MQQIIGLFIKDFMSFFRTYLGYAVVFIYLSMSALLSFYAGDMMEYTGEGAESFFLVQPWLLCFLIPALSAKVVSAEEEKYGSFEFLITQPMKYKDVLLAKFWAVFAFSGLLILMSLSFLAVMMQYMNINAKVLFSSYFGLLLLTAVYCAVGIVASFSSKNSFLQYLFGVMLCLFISFLDLDAFGELFLQPFGIYSPKIKGALSLVDNYSDLSSGEMAISAILLFVSAIMLWGFIGYLVFLKKRKSFDWKTVTASIFISVFAFMFFNVGTRLMLSEKSFDMTSTGINTIARESVDISNMLDNKVHVKLYISDTLGVSYPGYSTYASYVVKFFEKYAASSKNLSVEIINPKPYSVEAEYAKQYGLDPIMDENGNPMYFGAVFLSEDNNYTFIPVFLREKKADLQRDAALEINKLQKNYHKRTIGIVAPNLPILHQTYREKYAHWAFLEELYPHYNIERISEQTYKIPENIDVLVWVNPHNVPDSFAYALDQYLLHGGNIITFVDNYSEMELEYSSSIIPQSGNINAILQRYGISLDKGIVISNEDRALKTMLSKNENDIPRAYPLWMATTKQDAKNAVFGDLDSVWFKTAGNLRAASENYEMKPLFEISGKNGAVAVSYINNFAKDGNISQIVAVEETFVPAAMIEGNFESAYEPGSDENFVYLSIKEGKFAVIADSDFLSNSTILDEESTIAVKPYMFVAQNDNAKFLLNLIAYMIGDENIPALNKPVQKSDVLSVKNSMYEQVYAKYKEEITNNVDEQIATKKAIETIERAIKSKKITVSAEGLKDFYALNLYYEKLGKDKQELEYKVEYDFSQQRNSLIMKTIVWLPLFEMLLLVILYLLLQILYKKHIRRIME